MENEEDLLKNLIWATLEVGANTSWYSETKVRLGVLSDHRFVFVLSLLAPDDWEHSVERVVRTDTGRYRVVGSELRHIETGRCYILHTEEAAPDFRQRLLINLRNLLQYAEDTDRLFADQRPAGWQHPAVIEARKLLEEVTNGSL